VLYWFAAWVYYHGMVIKNKLDESANFSLPDQQTVTPSGELISSAIAGVKTFAPVNQVDHRGRVFEIYPGPNDFWTDAVVYCYAFTVRPHQTKGWGLHQEKNDRYTLIQGEVMTVLYDARLESPTHGITQRVVLSEQGIRNLLIPAGVWHANINLRETETFLINHPTEVYHHERPDRLLLSWNSPLIPVDLTSFFPTQLAFSHSDTCS